MSKKYEGELGKKRPAHLRPDEEKPPEWLADDAKSLKSMQDELNFWMDFFGLYLLRKHYGVDNWHDLALALARAHVPGFQYESKRGRPRDGDSFMRGVILAVAVRDSMEKGVASGVDDACRLLRREHQLFKDFWPDRRDMIQAYKDFMKNHADGFLDTMAKMAAYKRMAGYKKIDWSNIGLIIE